MFGFVNELIVRVANSCLQWGAGRIPPGKKEMLEDVREEWNDQHLGNLTGFRHRKAPNQITGHLEDKFFASDNREAVVSAISELSGWRRAYRRQMTDEEKESFSELIHRLSVVGRVVSSGRLVKVLDFRKFCLETNVFIISTWDWCLISESLHRLLGHSWEMIILNRNYGLLTESEQGSECSHKEERRNRQYLSRKCDLLSGDIDTFRHKYAAGDPGVRKFDRRPWCSHCKDDTHFTHGCVVRKMGPHLREDDFAVNSFFCTEETEPAEQKDLLEDLMNTWETDT